MRGILGSTRSFERPREKAFVRQSRESVMSRVASSKCPGRPTCKIAVGLHRHRRIFEEQCILGALKSSRDFIESEGS
jgi:hypothetical protein